MKIVITTGGTGGHIYPALAYAKEFQKMNPQVQILFVGGHRMEKQIIKEQGYSFEAIDGKGFEFNIFYKIKAFFSLCKGYFQAKHILKKFKPDLVVGFGGYISAPVFLAAKNQKIKILLHEQNSVLGKANKLALKFAEGMAICYSKVKEDYPKYAEKMKLIGNPRASEIIGAFDEQYFNSLPIKHDKPLVLIVMGSLASATINKAMENILNQVSSEYQFIYVSGKKDYQKMKDKIKKENVFVIDYIEQSKIMEKLDLIIARGGATTASEICVLGIPSIIIPSPYVANNHQLYNAHCLVDQKAAIRILEKDLKSARFNQSIDYILKDDHFANELKTNAKKNSFPFAARDLVNWSIEIIGQHE